MTTSPLDLLDETAKFYDIATKELGNIIVGQHDIIENLLIALLTGGHCLLVGVPGLAKTLLVKSLASIMDLSFRRIQFTPDLMPSDITGTEVIEEERKTGKRVFRFIPGPVFANIILADEINRTPPKTQSALLEAMQEHQVTSAGRTLPLEEPFFVLATQNPIEQEGTYPLPEAQQDRFMFQLNLTYPSLKEEKIIVDQMVRINQTHLSPVIEKERILEIIAFTQQIPVSDHLIDYAVTFVRKTRPTEGNDPFIQKYVKWGAGPRAAQHLVAAAKTRAAIHGKPTPDEEDINALLLPVLHHRILRTFAAEAEQIHIQEILHHILQKT
ncbi:MAG: MoxR family ATPase [Candidatus Marinimicrobia bacterium]|nr:MoxR family ATPase [Candidatus Neomarinimicrobiota bacterium]